MLMANSPRGPFGRNPGGLEHAGKANPARQTHGPNSPTVSSPGQRPLWSLDRRVATDPLRATPWEPIRSPAAPPGTGPSPIASPPSARATHRGAVGRGRRGDAVSPVQGSDRRPRPPRVWPGAFLWRPLRGEIPDARF